MKSDLENRLHRIAESIFSAMRRGGLDIPDYGLYSGRTGIVVFCLCYLKTYPDPEKEAVLEKYLDAFMDSITDTDIAPLSYCSGVIGIFDALRYFNEEGLYEVDFSDVEDNYRPLLQEYAVTAILRGNYDFLHGGLGIVKYFHDDAAFADRILDVLEQTAHKDGDKYKWLSQIGMEKKIGYNISLSHGMASIVAVLCLMDNPEIDREKRTRLITNACNYILSQQIDPEKYGSCFPSTSLENDPEEPIHRSRLGWCYGDLGIATSLWQAGHALRNRQWTDKALEVLLHATQRRNLSENAILDAGLCHGSASVAMMYYYMYGQTRNEKFLEACRYWMDVTLKRATHENETAGYEVWHTVEVPEYDKYNFLSGIAGIGMMMLTYLADNPDEVSWMNFFLLNTVMAEKAC